MSICALSLMVQVIAMTTLEIKSQKEELINQVTSTAALIAFNASTSIIFNDPDTEKTRLASFQAINTIENIHIYKKDEITEEAHFFTSYNKLGVPTVISKITQIEQLQTPTFTADYLEYIEPIEYEGLTYGYVYIRASLDKLKENQLERLTMSGVLLATLLIIALLLALAIKRRINRPIQSFVRTVQKISKEKDYSVRMERIPVAELDTLAKTFNIMLQRIEQTMHKRDKAEQENLTLNQNLEEKVNQRTIALKESNAELLATLEKMHQYQQQIVETEKMSSLGQMVAGVAHEVNTPIGLGVTASTLMLDKLRKIQEAFENEKLSANQLKRFLKEGEDNLNIIYRNLDRAAELISSFKQVAVDQSHEETRTFSCHKLLQEVLVTLRPHLKKVDHKITIDCDKQLLVTSKPGPLTQIIINLMMNSLIHAFDENHSGNININVELLNQQNEIKITYSDDGKGVAPEIQNKIFDPFVTTSRGTGGSGLGMHLVYNLVTQALQGRITMQTKPNKGATFEIVFPVIVQHTS